MWRCDRGRFARLNLILGGLLLAGFLTLQVLWNLRVQRVLPPIERGPAARARRSDGACGNFGAPPNPPFARSKDADMSWTADSTSSMVGRDPESVGRATIAFAMWSDCSTAPDRFVVHALATAPITSMKDGWPPMESFGKYVPANIGFCSGVRKTVIGHPPLPVVAVTTSM